MFNHNHYRKIYEAGFIRMNIVIMHEHFIPEFTAVTFISYERIIYIYIYDKEHLASFIEYSQCVDFPWPY